MKKLISIALLLVMCLSLFAGCANEEPATDSLQNAVDYLFNMYKGSGSKNEAIKISGDKEILAVVTIDGVKYPVEWTVEVTSGDKANVTIADGSKEHLKKIDLADVRETVTLFVLTATVRDDKGNSKSVSFNYEAPEAKQIVVDNGKEVVIFFPADELYVTSVVYNYTSSSGSTKAELVLSEKKSDAMVLVMNEKDGFVTFKTKDGKYLFCDGTNVNLADAEGDFTKFTLEAAAGGTFIKSNAFYNDNPEKPQYLEVYSGYLTCYGMNAEKANIYTFTLEDAEGAGTTTPDDPNKPETPDNPEDPPKDLDPTGKTPAELVDLAYTLEAGAGFTKPVTLTGVVIQVNTAYSDQYKNVTVTIVVEGKTDKPIECFRMKGDEAANVAVGDTITVTGDILRYVNDTGSVDKIEFNSGCTLDARVPGTTEPQPTEPVIPSDPTDPTDPPAPTEPSIPETTAPTEPSVPETTVPAPTDPTDPPAPVVPGLDTSKPYFIHSVISTGDLYFSGTMGTGGADGRIMGVADKANAVTVKLESAGADGEYYICFTAGTVKTYLCMTTNASAGLGFATTKDDSCVWVVDANAKTIINKSFSTRGLATQVASTYMNMSSYSTTNLESEEYHWAWLVEADKEQAGPAIEEEKPVEPATEPEYVKNPEIGKAYKFGLYQAKKEAVNYFTGAMKGYYGETTTTKENAIDVYLEDAGNGKYHIYFTAADGEKTYIYAEVSGTHLNFKIGQTKGEFTWNAELGTFTTVLDGADVVMGTSGNYYTFGILEMDELDGAYLGRLYN